MKGAMLNGTKLDQANLHGADLTAATFLFAELRNAKLHNTNLYNADFEMAQLEGADFSTAQNLTQEQINQAFGDKDTKLPPGLKQPLGWLEQNPDEGPPFTALSEESSKTVDLNLLIPLSLEWTGENRIVVGPARVPPPPNGLSREVRDELINTLARRAEEIAQTLPKNADLRITQKFAKYSTECHMGGKRASIIYLDDLASVIGRAKSEDPDQYGTISLLEIDQFLTQHKRLTSHYPNLGLLQQADRNVTDIPAPPIEGIVDALTEYPASEVIDESVANAASEIVIPEGQETTHGSEPMPNRQKSEFIAFFGKLLELLSNAPKVDKITSAVLSILNKLSKVWDYVQEHISKLI